MYYVPSALTEMWCRFTYSKLHSVITVTAKTYIHTDGHLEKPYQTGIFSLQHFIATKNHPTPKDSLLHQLPMIFPTLKKKHSRDHHLVQNHPPYLI